MCEVSRCMGVNNGQFAQKKDRLLAFEIWCYNRMGRVRWAKKVRNEEVLRRSEEERNFIK